jgi:hypothetical protein
MLYGVSKTIIDHISLGDRYSVLRKVYSVNIVYFDFGTGRDYVYHGKTHFKGLHEDDELQLSAAQRETFGKLTGGDLFPEYYILKVNSFNDVAKDTLDEWIYYLKHSQIKDGFKAQGLKKAAELLDLSRLTPEEKRVFEKSVDTRRSNESSIWSAKMEEKMEIARNSARAGLPAATISAITGLSEEAVRSILQELSST